MTAWFPEPARPRRHVGARLFCFGHAGAAPAVFRTWPDELAEDIEVRAAALPARGPRIREPPLRDLSALVGSLAVALERLVDVPYALFGHSFGALLAFELARELRRRRKPAPLLLCVAGRRAPHLPHAYRLIGDLPDEQLIAELRSWGGIPDEVARHSDLLALLLPALRADLTLNESYRFAPDQELDCDLSAFAGSLDLLATGADVAAWRVHTRRGFTFYPIVGGHFFVHDTHQQLLGVLNQALR